MTDLHQTYYRQVKNPNPVFTPRKGAGTLKFCEKLMEKAVASARRSRVEWENRQRKKQGLDALGMDELIAKAWRFVRERFRSYQTELKSRGIKRARARRDAGRERQDIVTLVKRQLTREISEGRFTASREAVKREVERRVKERMILSRNRNYSRLATASP
ncbi:plasmid replication initiator RepA (plasmid) [Escherichia coli]